MTARVRVRVRVLVLGLMLASCGVPVRPPLAQLPADGQLYDPGPSTTAFTVVDRFRGKVVVLDFWAAWCAECRRTIPQVTRLATAFAADGLVVIGVNVGESAADAIAHARELGIGYPIALDPELEFSDRVGAARLPMLLVIDRSGAVAHRTKLVDAETLAVIRRLLGR